MKFEVEELQKRFGIPEEQAMLQMQRQYDFTALLQEGRLAERIGDRWAGAHIDHSDGATAYVFVASDAAQKLSEELNLPKWVVVKQVKSSYQEMDQALRALVEGLSGQDTKSGYSGASDFMNNRVAITVQKGSPEAARIDERVTQLAKSGSNVDVEVTLSDGPRLGRAAACPDSCNSDVLYGGIDFYTSDLPNQSFGLSCTAGFNFRLEPDDGSRYSSTAGHCGNHQWSNGYAWKNNVNGLRIGQSVGNRVIVARRADYQLIAKDPIRTNVPAQIWRPGNWYMNVWLDIINFSSMGTGNMTCYITASSRLHNLGDGHRCGLLTAVNLAADVNTNGTVIHAYDMGLIAQGACHADSGGAVYTDDGRAYGLSRAVFGDPDGNNCAPTMSFSWMDIVESYSGYQVLGP